MFKLLPAKKLPKINQILLFIFVAIVFFVIGASWKLPYQYTLIQLYQKSYAELVFKCDNVMKEHYISKAKLMNQGNEQNLKELWSSELGLVECHRYDKLRKKLVWYGLTENELAMMGLKAIEINKADLRKIVVTHEIND